MVLQSAIRFREFPLVTPEPESHPLVMDGKKDFKRGMVSALFRPSDIQPPLKKSEEVLNS
jgi:hypothetical protein